MSETAERTRRFVEERNEQEIVLFLRRMLNKRIPALRPEYDPDVPLGFAYPRTQDAFDLEAAEAVKLLEDLAGHGLLDRRLVDKIHLCPSCGWHTLNFVEVCPRCSEIEIQIENVIHHFACAYVGPWSEFKRGVDLVCPKCEDELRHLGMDYEKPGDTYICDGCGHVFTQSDVEAHCLRCEHVTPAQEIEPTRVHEYTPNAKTSRAVEYGRIFGLDIQSVLFQDRTRTFRRDFLIFELDRELYRSRRYDAPLSLILVNVQGLEQATEADGGRHTVELQAEVFEEVAETLRDLDVVSAVDGDLAAVLLPETTMHAGTGVAERVRDIIRDFQGVNMHGDLRVTCAVAELLPEHESGVEFFEYAHELLLWAVKNSPGDVVSAAEWEDAGDV